MSKTLNSIVFDIHSQEKDVVVLKAYATDANTLSYKRILPKRTKDFPGMEKTEVKHTLVDPLTGATLAIHTISTSVLATATSEQRQSSKALMAAVIADATYASLLDDQRLPLSL